jgi:hypothetical protein
MSHLLRQAGIITLIGVIVFVAKNELIGARFIGRAELRQVENFENVRIFNIAEKIDVRSSLLNGFNMLFVDDIVGGAINQWRTQH